VRSITISNSVSKAWINSSNVLAIIS
jgi:hypothetical protein